MFARPNNSISLNSYLNHMVVLWIYSVGVPSVPHMILFQRLI